jgi:hypothetical protein
VVLDLPPVSCVPNHVDNILNTYHMPVFQLTTYFNQPKAVHTLR